MTEIRCKKESREINRQTLSEFIKRRMGERFYGKITITFEDGGIVLVKVEETIKL